MLSTQEAVCALSHHNFCLVAYYLLFFHLKGYGEQQTGMGHAVPDIIHLALTNVFTEHLG